MPHRPNPVLRRTRWCMSMLATICACGRGETPAPHRTTEAPLTTYAALSAAFDSAPPQRNVDMTGVWVAVSSIATSQFREGRDGPDVVDYDSTGIKITSDS